MARAAEIAQNATVHWGNLLTPTVKSDAQLSWYSSSVRRAYALSEFFNM